MILKALAFSICGFFITAFSLSAQSTETKNDTLLIEKVYYNGAQKLRTPFITNEKNLHGQAFDATEILKNNATLALNLKTDINQMLTNGAPLDSNALSVIHFTVDVKKWTKFMLNVPKIKQFETYLNGVQQYAGTELRLRPGRSSIALLIYSPASSRDTMEISLVGKNLTETKINSTDKRMFSLDDMTHGKRFYSMSISPSGRYLVTYYTENKRNGQTEWYTVLTDFNTNKTLLNQSSYVHFSWMPRRDVLYSTRNTDKGKQIITLDPSTMRETILASGLPEGNFTISPNEKFIIVNVNDEGPKPNGALKQLIAPDDRQPGWRERSSLFLYDIASGTMQRLTYGKEHIGLSDISEDGKRILISRSTMNPNRTPFSASDYYEMNLETGQVDTLFKNEPWLNSAQYSPDGHQILFTATPAAFNGIGSEVKENQHPQGFDQRLFLFDISSKKATPLLRNFNPSVGRVQWNTADGMIYIRCTDGSDETLWRVNPKNGNRFRYNLPVSALQGTSIANTKNPRIAFFGQTGISSRNGYLATLSSATPKCLPFGEVSFEKEFGDVQIASCTPWKFTTSRGDQIEGFYYLPADFDATKKYPMIVYYYGGCVPTTRTLEFHYPLSVMANQGYVVLVIQPSGAIGFGQEFAARHVNTWGQMSANDIIEGTKTFCANNSYVDTKKIGCMGASYGGFMTQYLQTQTDIFATGVSHAGISNIASYWGGGYWGYTYGETANYGSYPWNNPELFTKQSPLLQADKIKTPLLLIHGTSDTNVPTNESQQLFTALRILGREVSYIQVDGEDHVIQDYFKRAQWQEAIMAWMDKQLKGDDTWWKDLGFE